LRKTRGKASSGKRKRSAKRSWAHVGRKRVIDREIPRKKSEKKEVRWVSLVRKGGCSHGEKDVLGRSAWKKNEADRVQKDKKKDCCTEKTSSERKSPVPKAKLSDRKKFVTRQKGRGTTTLE